MSLGWRQIAKTEIAQQQRERADEAGMTNMPRQWMMSATMPAAAAPSRLPEMVALSSRPIMT